MGAGGRTVCGVMKRGAGGGGVSGCTGFGAGGAVATGAAVIGFVSAGGAGFGGTAIGRAAGGGAAAACCCFVICLSTSPGREMCERSIFVLNSPGSRVARLVFAAAFSPDALKCARTLSASKSSTELECVFFSVTPTSTNTSRMALLLTSSSLARSLIRILLIRPFFAPTAP